MALNMDGPHDLVPIDTQGHQYMLCLLKVLGKP